MEFTPNHPILQCCHGEFGTCICSLFIAHLKVIGKRKREKEDPGYLADAVVRLPFLFWAFTREVVSHRPFSAFGVVSSARWFREI